MDAKIFGSNVEILCRRNKLHIIKNIILRNKQKKNRNNISIKQQEFHKCITCQSAIKMTGKYATEL